MTALKRKFGPLPAYAWLGMFAVAVLVYRTLRPGVTTTADTGTPSTLAADSSGLGFGAAAGGGGGNAPLPPTDAALPPTADLTGGGGTPVIFDPVSGNYVPYDPSGSYTPPGDTGASLPADPNNVLPPAGGVVPYTGPLSYGRPGYVIDPTTGQVYGPSTSVEGGIRQRIGKPAKPPGGKQAPAAATKPTRPASSKGRQTPRVYQHSPGARQAPARVPAPVAVVHTAPPMPAPKKRTTKPRPTAQQAHNHGEPAPARARSVPVAAPKRTMQAVAAPTPSQSGTAPVRSAAPSAAAPAVLQLAPGRIPQPGKVYSE